jgi:tetratricopeptide (TPR) repeat protein
VSDFTYDVFISYSHNDVDWVRNWLLPRLEAAGLRVCVDFRDFDIGGAALDNMTEAAKQSRKTLFVMTPNWTVSEFSQFEALVIQTIDPIGRKRRLLPLMLKETDLSTRLQIFTYADFKAPNNWETELARVINNIRESSAPPKQPPARLAPNLVHPYPMQANFTGRASERQELSAWLPDDTQPICALIAMGGMGKSALCWHWLNKDVLVANQLSPTSAIEGVMWWSFYEGESSFAKFIDEALKYVTGQSIDAQSLPSTYDRAQELRRQLQAKRILFILDGFERQLRAYTRLDAAYKQDDIDEPSRDARSCVDPIAARWLRDIAAGTSRAKVLLTTRLMLSDLEDQAGAPLAGILKRELNELPSDDAVAFMQSQGVTKGTDTEIAEACEGYGNHPLSLRLLSGLIASDRRTPGDIAAAPRHNVHANLIQRQHHILEQSYNALTEKARALLSRIAAFRNPMTYDAIAIFNDFGDERNFNAALDELQERGLLQRDLQHDRYDLHPIVRHYTYDRLTDKMGVHSRLRDYFANIPTPDENKIQSIEDLGSVIELYHHTARAGHYEEALELFYVRLAKLLFYRFGDFLTCIELLQALFPKGEDQPPQLTDKESQAWTMDVLASSYAQTGQPRRSIILYNWANDVSENVTHDMQQLGIGLENIATEQTLLGELASAEGNLRRRLELSRALKDTSSEARGHQILGWLLNYCGVFDEAEKELNEGMSLYGDTLDEQWWKGTSWLYLAQSALLRDDIPQAIKSAREAKRLKDIEFPGVGKVERGIVEAELMLGSSLIAGGDFDGAEACLSEAIKRCRRINLVEFEPDILLAWGCWHYARGNAQEAQTYAEEALAIAGRCQYRLKQAGIHNFLARLALEASRRTEARKHSEIARERAWCDGPQYCYKPALDEAEKMLMELGAEEGK